MTGSNIAERSSDGKLVADLALGNGERLEVAMSPRAAQRLRDQLNGLLDQHKKRLQN